MIRISASPSRHELHQFVPGGLQHGFIPFVVAGQLVNAAGDAQLVEQLARQGKSLQSIGGRNVQGAVMLEPLANRLLLRGRAAGSTMSQAPRPSR